MQRIHRNTESKSFWNSGNKNVFGLYMEETIKKCVYIYEKKRRKNLIMRKRIIYLLLNRMCEHSLEKKKTNDKTHFSIGIFFSSSL